MKRDEAALINRLEALATVGGDGIPRLAAVPGRLHPELLRVWCRYCKCWHLHGAGGGHRVAHCGDVDRHCRPIVSPYKDTGYFLVVAPDDLRAIPCKRDDLAPGANLARPGGPGGPRADKIAAAVTDFLRGRKAGRAPEYAPRKPHEGEKGDLLADTRGGSSPTRTRHAADAGRVGAAAVGVALAVALGVFSADPQNPPKGRGRMT